MTITTSAREIATTNLIDMIDDVSCDDATIDSLIEMMKSIVRMFDCTDTDGGDDIEVALDDAWQWIKHDSLATSDQRREAKALYREYLLGY